MKLCAASGAAMSPRDVGEGVRRGGRWDGRERSTVQGPVCFADRLFHSFLIMVSHCQLSFIEISSLQQSFFFLSDHNDFPNTSYRVVIPFTL